MKLLLIGAGAWARKIESVCNTFGESIQSTVVPARELLLNGIPSTFELNSYDRIWICTQPRLQIEILKLLKLYQGLVILEKPYVERYLDFPELTQLGNEIDATFVLSQPWTFSNSWKAFKALASVDLNQNFVVTRVGEKVHSYIDAVADWLPHDLNLILDLTKEQIYDVSVDSQAWNTEKDRVEFEITVNRKNKFIIDTGLNSDGRKATWSRGDYKVDFLTSRITDPSNNEARIDIGHPIVEFLKSCDTQITHSFEVNVSFHNLVMTELGI